MTFRSLQMKQYQIFIPRDSLYATFNYIGYQDAIHLTDSSDPANRSFSHTLKRCQECLQKIRIITQTLKMQKLQFEEYDQADPQFVEDVRRNWKQQAKAKGIQESRLLDLYQEKVVGQYKRFLHLSSRIDKVTQNRKSNLDKIACLQTLAQFMGDARPRRDNQQYYIKNISEVKQIQSVSFMIGVISYEIQWKISKMIYRISRGYACTKTLSSFKFPGLKNFNKKVILVIYPSSENQILQKRIHRILQSYCDNQFLQHQFQYIAKQEYEKCIKQYNELTNLLQMEQKQYKEFLSTLVKVNNIETWRIYFWKQRSLYQNLNKLYRREQFYIANVYIPKKQLRRVSLLLSRITPSPALNQSPLQYPPTAFQTNSYTDIAQEITDTYGVPRYQEINPSIFTTITFPFFFGVMFGDIAHGAMVFALGLYAIYKKDQLQQSYFGKILVRMRYMITLMGFFSIYCGFVYNDLAGFNMNFFNSCFDPPFHQKSDDNIQMTVHSKPNCVYPFGIDPVWGRAQNELVFVNSLKMKISVIIAIIHMTLGIFCKAANSLFFRKKIDFYFQFLPQVVFLVGLFGYMDFLIIFKWLTKWDQKIGTIPPQQWAPSIISTMMNIGLALGKTSSVPDGNSNMWGSRGSSSQDTIQIVLMLVAFVCIPLMLIPKPYINIRKNKQRSILARQNPLDQQNMVLESRNALRERLESSNKDQMQSKLEQHEQSSQIIVHQLIETIQFVLGTVSNTASYLRLWALSLAHSQLSKVFFQQTAGRFFGTEMYFEIPSLFVGSWLIMWITFAIILCMDSMECFLHSLRLHWVQFQNKFYKGDGYKYKPISFKSDILKLKQQN